MPATIKEFRVSFIWFETLLTFLGDQPFDINQMPFSFLGNPGAYSQKFQQVLLDQDKTTQLSLPWKQAPVAGIKPKQRFWVRYLESEADNVTPQSAWKALMPFRGKVPQLKVTSSLPLKQLSLEAFYYPCGVALVVTACCEEDLTLQDMVSKANDEIRSGANFQVEVPGTPTTTCALDDLANIALNLLRKQAWGQAEPAGPRTDPPFSIFTVVRAEGVDPSVPVPPNGEIHRDLEALTKWDRNPYSTPTALEQANLIAIEQANLPPENQGKSTRAPGAVLYATKKGRAIWFPDFFINPRVPAYPKQKGPSSLVCYHRNLVYATMQVASLCGLVTKSLDLTNDFNNLPYVHLSVLPYILKTLGRLYGGKQTYNSWSIRFQLDQNDLVPIINTARHIAKIPDELK